MSLHILLIDDDETSIFIHKTLVETSALSLDPLCFSSSAATLDYLEKHHRTGDRYVLLLDINMPVIDGWAFMDAIQQKPYADALFILIVTSSIDRADRKRASEYKQVIEYFEKPLDIDHCIQTIQQNII
ncbi:response regulator [Cesiribacter andamanensis]|uniref:Nitrogen assimilation regulatory protein n=1 Tax=Cesiribacter andamanensis AMV16 TaxID=1279009 RepID=M7NL77_9BACT|nr:response regulator [Cesiribacter andamanensis]EMR02550.1 Nitrogen assimilation regulatory protein [Cesiribacter andamanensis AMV16]